MSLTVFVGDLCVLWPILKRGYIVGYPGATSWATQKQKAPETLRSRGFKATPQGLEP